jgi:hypothetical protein
MRDSTIRIWGPPIHFADVQHPFRFDHAWPRPEMGVTAKPRARPAQKDGALMVADARASPKESVFR